MVYRTDFYLGLQAGSSEFHRIGNEITEHQPEHGRISVADRQIPDVPDNLPALHICRHFLDHAFHWRFVITACLLRFAPAASRTPTKIIHPPAYTSRGTH